MPTLIDGNGNRYEYTTLVEHEASLTLDGDLFVQGKLTDFTLDNGTASTPAEIRRAEIEAELTAIDAASARPLRAILAATADGGTADPTDVARLAELEAQAVALRSELAALAELEG